MELAFVWPQIKSVSGPEAWMSGKKIECARGSTEIVEGTSMCIACEVVAFGGGGADAEAVAESEVRTISALAEGELLGLGENVGSTVGDELGEGEAVGSEVGVGLAEGDVPSTVPRIGLNRSSAKDFGATITKAINERPNIAFFALVAEWPRMLERVMKIGFFHFFGRVIPEWGKGYSGAA